MKRILLSMVLTALALPAGAQTVVDGSATAIPEGKLSQAIELLRAEIDDPRSLQLRRLRFDTATGRICGEYNARNALGGYGAFRPFMSIGKQAVVTPDPSHPYYQFHRDWITRDCA